ncbi:MAG TPA: hypothetical protein VHL98_17320 [Microvirga sp.]|jgi:hypothetical protein|nr:hypothetical protein [Microvirga sp.]
MRMRDQIPGREEPDQDADDALSYDDLAELNRELIASLQHAVAVAVEVTGLPAEHFLLPEESVVSH